MELMRWEDLFADLEAQAAALDAEQRADEIAERTRIEVGSLGLGERLQAAIGASIRVRLPGELTVSGQLQRCGPDWMSLEEGYGREALIALPAVLSVGGLARAALPPGSGGLVASRLMLRQLVRAVVRDRSAVRLHLIDASVLDATLDRVGADFVDVALHAPGEARRRTQVREVQVVPLRAIAAVRRGAVSN